MDFIKERLGVEVQFKMEVCLHRPYNVCAKMTIKKFARQDLRPESDYFEIVPSNRLFEDIGE